MRAIPFGPWSISELWPGGVFSGYGANCYRHRNCWQNASCKRQFRFAGNTPDETRCIAKQWLLMGLPIRCDLRNGKHQHMDAVARSAIPILPEAELDRRAAALL
jgi:hypothetical protein